MFVVKLVRISIDTTALLFWSIHSQCYNTPSCMITKARNYLNIVGKFYLLSYIKIENTSPIFIVGQLIPLMCKPFAAFPFPDALVIVNINLHPLVCCQFWIKPKRCFRCLSSVRCHKGSSLNNNFIVRNAIYCCFQWYLLAVRSKNILHFRSGRQFS